MVSAFFIWWYGPGWRLQSERMMQRLLGVADTFSFSLLLGSLFAPFRQISAGRVRGPLGVQFRAWLDRLISRFIGALIRIGMLLFGGVAFLGCAVWSIAYLAVWPLLPAMPIIGIILAVTGWVV
jgi:hypothetical protein